MKMNAVKQRDLLRDTCPKCSNHPIGPVDPKEDYHASWCPEKETKEKKNFKDRVKNQFINILGDMLDGEFTASDIQECVNEAIVRRTMEE